MQAEAKETMWFLKLVALVGVAVSLLAAFGCRNPHPEPAKRTITVYPTIKAGE